jgi:hypothetical protein
MPGVHGGDRVKQKRLKFPAPYFGGKSKVAPLVWARLGDVDNFIEPFVGSGAVLLARPSPPRVETINDLDCMVANFWRATRHDPEAVAEYADWPVNEIDLHSRHRWLVLSDDARAFRERMRADPDHYDPKIAGWWCWGLCVWIGGGWCATPETGPVHGPVGGSGLRRPDCIAKAVHAKGERPHEWQQMPHLTDEGCGVAAAGPGLHQKRPFIGGLSGQTGMGIHAGRPQLADAYSRGRGVHGTDAADRYLSQQMPKQNQNAGGWAGGVHSAGPGHGGTCASRRAWLIDWFSRLRDRLRTVRVCCGDWRRVCDSDSVTVRLGTTGIFFDPPYSTEAGRDNALYAQDSGTVAHDVRAYCLERGADPRYRIALCGYEGEGHDALVGHGWDVVAWQAGGGYGNRSKKGKANAKRERLYFSPGCVKPDLGLFRDFA